MSDNVSDSEKCHGAEKKVTRVGEGAGMEGEETVSLISGYFNRDTKGCKGGSRGACWARDRKLSGVQCQALGRCEESRAAAEQRGEEESSGACRTPELPHTLETTL